MVQVLSVKVLAIAWIPYGHFQRPGQILNSYHSSSVCKKGLLLSSTTAVLILHFMGYSENTIGLLSCSNQTNEGKLEDVSLFSKTK